MTEKNREISRRKFIAGASAAGVGSILAAGLAAPALAAEATTGSAQAQPAAGKVPTRTFGKTGEKVAMLSLGGIFDITANLLVLRKALDLGVTYWDTAAGYMNGNSEIGIGNYFEKFPESRKQVFLVTKSSGRNNPNGMSETLKQSLERMKTDYIDLFFMHGINKADALTPEVKAWAEKMKADKKIRFFGFSTHSNMAQLLSDAAKLGWIDGIMMTYNYRLMHEDAMKAGVEACHKAGIGLTAMKTQGGGQVKDDSEAELNLGGRFLAKGFTPQQAKMKAVWDNEAIAAICSAMYTVTVLQSNADAALDKTKLTAADLKGLREYADATCSGYCAGCSEICEGAMAQSAPIGDLMRLLMYNNSYGSVAHVRQVLAELPAGIRDRLGKLDYSAAEQACPRGLKIGKLMDEAASLLA
jgi:uncharacterized protein